MKRPHVLLALALACAPLHGALAAEADIEKVNGSITVEASQRAGALATVNGSIAIGAGATVRDARTVNGSIKAGDEAATGALTTVNGSIRIEQRARIGGDIQTVNGGVFVGRGGRVDGGIETVNGAIGLVDTDVAGDIQTVNGDLTVGAGSHVRGRVHYAKVNRPWLSMGKPRLPRVVVGPQARIDGPLVFEREVKLYVHTSARTGPVTGATAIAFDTPTAPAD